MKRGLEAFAPGQVAAIRMSVAFICLFPFVIGSIRKIPHDKWKYIIAAGVLGNGIPSVLFTTAETKLSSSIAGVLNSLTPVFTLIVGAIFFKFRTTTTKTIGIVLGFVGAVIIMMFNPDGGFESNYYYGLFIIIACITYAVDTFILNNYLSELNAIDVAGFALFVVGIFSIGYLFTTDFTQRLASNPVAWKSLACASLLGAMGTATAQALFNKMLKISSPLFSASVTYCIPIVAVIWGLVDHERLGVMHIVGFATVFAGVYLIGRRG
jgi:drug/metabolite transporter (DMT)-like permease